MPKPQQRERQFIVDYIMDRYPDDRVKYNVPLGYPPTKLVATFGLSKALKVAMGSRPMVDAIVFKDHTLILVEAKIREWMNGVSKLPVYKALVPDTPELAEYHSWPIKMVFCLPYTNETIEAVCDRLGVILDPFTSDTVTELMRDVEKYWTPEWRKKRAQDRVTMERLGLD